MFWALPAAPAQAAQTVTAISPPSADAGTVLDVTITGSGFVPNAQVFGSSAYLQFSNVQVVNSTTITAHLVVSPEADHVSYGISVYEPGQPAAVTCANCFHVTGVEVFSVSPNQLPRGATTTVTITGTKFEPGAQVGSSDVPLQVLSSQYVSPTTMRATIAVTGDVRVPRQTGLYVRLPNGANGGCTCVTIVGTPVTITSITPNRIRRGVPSTTVTIRGTGFRLGMGSIVPAVTISDPTFAWFRPPVSNLGFPPFGTGIPRFVSPTELSVDIGTLQEATLGPYDVRVLNFGDDVAGGCNACLSVNRFGYWMVESGGGVHGFGDSPVHGTRRGAVVVDIEPAGHSTSYWIVDRTGAVTGYGPDAGHFGGLGPNAMAAGEEITSMSSMPAGNGYWLFTTRGRVFAFGAARSFGDMGSTRLNGPVLDSVSTPSGTGYYMVASDGGIFAFGDARFAGSMGGRPLNAPVESLVPDRDGTGYWLVASDGGVFAFSAEFRGSMGGQRLNKPVTGMVRYGDGYLMVAADGGIFAFSDVPFLGSLGANPPPSPIVAVAAAPES